MSMSEAFMMNMKPGCRGDPRMNLAVAAKLKNPHISLFDALAAGGFTYPRNVDAATMDNDLVTLGQRKNQLNRRLRLARQNLETDNKKGGKRSKAEGDSPISRPKNIGASALTIANSYLRQQRGKGAMNSAAKNAAAVKSEHIKPEKQCANVLASANIASHVPSAIANLSTSSGISLRHDMIQRSVSPVGDASLITLPTSNTNAIVAINTGIAASWSGVSGFANPLEHMPNMSQHAKLAPAKSRAGGTEQNLVTICIPIHNSNGFTQTAIVGFPDDTNSYPQQQMFASQESAMDGYFIGAPHPMAMPEQEELIDNSQKQELGLHIFQHQLQDLYMKSMVAAGFTQEETSEKSQTFQKFAFTAWKRECERLQLVLKDHVVDQSGHANLY